MAGVNRILNIDDPDRGVYRMHGRRQISQTIS